MNKRYPSFFEYLGIPGFITLFSLWCGWLAIILILKNLPFHGIISAIVAFFFDCLDGYIARKTKTVSEFGRQLDGCVDFFNYLVFSSLLFWKYISPDNAGIVVGYIILATGSFRLIRFNIEGFVIKHNNLYYTGIVVCHVSLTTILLYFLLQFYPNVVHIIAVPVVLIVSCLQVSRIHIKKTNSYPFWLSVAFLLLLVSLFFILWHK